MDKQVLGRSISPPRKNPSGKLIASGQKQILINVYKYTVANNPDMKYRELVEHLSKQTGIGRETVVKTLSEYKSTGVVTSPNKKRVRLNILEKMSDENIIAIRKKINECWFRREIPNMKKLSAALNSDEKIPSFSNSTLHRLLTRLEFKSIFRQGKSALIEQSNIILCRQNYIKSMANLRSQGRPVYFLDEMCINVGDCRKKLRLDSSNDCPKDAEQRETSTSGIPASSRKEKRLIIAHIGSSDGFVPEALLYFEAKKTTGDFHNEIDEATFFEWFRKILPMLRDRAVIVMDNASCHNGKKEQCPTTNMKTSDIVAWLKAKGEKIEPWYGKVKLLELVEKHRQSASNHVIDEYARERGCTVVRIPDYHFELNPIRLAWAKIEDYIEARKATYKLADIRQLVVEAIETVTSKNWQDFVYAAIGEERNIYALDRVIESVLDENDNWVYSTEESEYDE